MEILGLQKNRGAMQEKPEIDKFARLGPRSEKKQIFDHAVTATTAVPRWKSLSTSQVQ